MRARDDHLPASAASAWHRRTSAGSEAAAALVVDLDQRVAARPRRSARTSAATGSRARAASRSSAGSMPAESSVQVYGSPRAHDRLGAGVVGQVVLVGGRIPAERRPGVSGAVSQHAALVVEQRDHAGGGVEEGRSAGARGRPASAGTSSPAGHRLGGLDQPQHRLQLVLAQRRGRRSADQEPSSRVIARQDCRPRLRIPLLGDRSSAPVATARWPAQPRLAIRLRSRPAPAPR